MRVARRTCQPRRLGSIVSMYRTDTSVRVFTVWTRKVPPVSGTWKPRGRPIQRRIGTLTTRRPDGEALRSAGVRCPRPAARVADARIRTAQAAQRPARVAARVLLRLALPVPQG